MMMTWVLNLCLPRWGHVVFSLLLVMPRRPFYRGQKELKKRLLLPLSNFLKSLWKKSDEREPSFWEITRGSAGSKLRGREMVFFVPGKYKERLFRWRGGFSVSFHVEIFLLGEPKANPEEDRNVKTNWKPSKPMKSRNEIISSGRNIALHYKSNSEN